MNRLFTLLTPVALTAVALAAVACGADAGPRLVVPGNNTLTATLGNTTANKPYNFAFMRVCLTRPGKVHVTGAELIKPDHLVLRAVATRARPVGRQRTFRSLWQAGFTPGRQVVDRECDPKIAPTTIGFEFARQGNKTGSTQGILVHYRSGERNRSMVVPFFVVLCAPGDTTTGDCRLSAHDDPDPYRRALLRD